LSLFQCKKGLSIIVSPFLCAAFIFTVNSSIAETIYKYQDEKGKWHFTNRSDKAPDSAEQSQYKKPTERPQPRLEWRNKQLIAHNPYFGPVQVVLYSDNAKSRSWLLDANSERVLLDEFDEEYREHKSYFIWGDPKAEISPYTYALPVASNATADISQGFNGEFSHNTADHEYAVDIAMPIGTAIHAARAGVVMMVKDDYHMGGTNAFFLDKANRIAVLHSDGSIALYAHILLGAAKVKAGDSVNSGDILALSGSSGYSSGPHLHFAIYKNAGAKSQSLYFDFSVKGKAVEPQRGMLLRNNK
jgi:murein DD-endopeptidase MepM/ murein hydrolase activator NlpD